jgi:hypothetical protein
MKMSGAEPTLMLLAAVKLGTTRFSRASTVSWTL